MTTTPAPNQETIDRFVIFCHGNMAGAQEMLAADPALINSRSTLAETPLAAAAHVGNRAMAEYLLAEGAELELPAAAMLGMEDEVRARVAADPSLANAAGAHGFPILFHAVIGGNFALAQYLVEQGADTSGDLAGSLLHAAVRAGHVEMAAWTISLGAGLDSLDYERKTPLQRAEESGNAEMIALLRRSAS
jgi:ankyrin repeat protein